MEAAERSNELDERVVLDRLTALARAIVVGAALLGPVGLIDKYGIRFARSNWCLFYGLSQETGKWVTGISSMCDCPLMFELEHSAC